jgi:hypothetical protein
MITTDGTMLFLAGGGMFKSLDPKTGTWSDLPIPTITLNGTGALSYHNGIIYAREGGGRGFAKYTIATATWENLSPVPGDALQGSTIDPVKKRFYAYGKNDESFLYEYDINSNLWNMITFPLFEVGEGGIANISQADNAGIYFLQGSAEGGFGRYTPSIELNWLRSSSLSGEIPAAGNQSVGINFSAFGLQPGLYAGSLYLNSNDPNNAATEIPVSFHVTSPPAITIPEKLSIKVDRLTLHSFQLRIQNTGGKTLHWNFTNTLPPLITAAKTGGSLSAQSTEDIQLTFNPITETGIYTYVIDITSNDPIRKNVWTLLEIEVVNNHGPFVSSLIPNQSLTSAIQLITLSGKFSDPDHDPLTFSAVSTDNGVVAVEVSDSILRLQPITAGQAMITVTAHDIFSLSASTSFEVSVNPVVSVEQNDGYPLTAVPNPFREAVKFRYHCDNPGLADLTVLDISGKVLWRSGDYTEVTGLNEIEMETREFAQGIYSCKLRKNGNVVKTIRLVKY